MQSSFRKRNFLLQLIIILDQTNTFNLVRQPKKKRETETETETERTMHYLKFSDFNYFKILSVTEMKKFRV